jgi:hypothetical protein
MIIAEARKKTVNPILDTAIKFLSRWATSTLRTSLLMYCRDLDQKGEAELEI